MFIDILILYHINLSSNIFMNFLKNKTILINGGTGSFGSNFVKELLKNKYDIKKIIIFILDELKQFELQKKFQNNGIAATFHYVPLHKSRMGKQFCNYKLPITENIYNRVVRLPLYSELKKREINKISSLIKKFIITK